MTDEAIPVVDGEIVPVVPEDGSSIYAVLLMHPIDNKWWANHLPKADYTTAMGKAQECIAEGYNVIILRTMRPE